MRVKTFVAFTENGLDKKVNEFINDSYMEVIDIKFSISMYAVSALVIYNEK